MAERSEHAEFSELVDRADSLMRGDGSASARRRRSFIAAPARAAAAVAPSDDDGLPVLTEVVSAEPDVAEAAVPGDEANAASDLDNEAMLSMLAADLADSLEQQLAVELPTLIEATLLNARNELLAGVHSTLELALRNFLASRQLPPPPEDAPDAYRVEDSTEVKVHHRDAGTQRNAE